MDWLKLVSPYMRQENLYTLTEGIHETMGRHFGVTMHDYEQTLSKLIGRKSTNTPFLEDLIGCFEESANRKLSKRDS